MDSVNYTDITLESPYEEGLPRAYFPVLYHPSGKKFVYHSEINEETNEVEGGFFAMDRWNDEPKPVTDSQQKLLDLYFLKSYISAGKYAKSNDWKGIKLRSIFPILVYELLPHSINIMDDGKKVTGCLEIWPDNPEPTLVISEVNENGELVGYDNVFEKRVIDVLTKRYSQTFIDYIAKDNKAHNFSLTIPLIHSSNSEYEEINNVNCSWKRIVKIASYYSRYGLSVIRYGHEGMVLWASYKHKRLPIPFTRYDVDKAKIEWEQKVYDNPYLENHISDGDNLTRWDYEILEKAKGIKTDDDLPQ